MDGAGGSDENMYEEDDLGGLDMNDQIQVIQLDESAHPTEPIDDDDGFDDDEDQQSTST